MLKCILILFISGLVALPKKSFSQDNTGIGVISFDYTDSTIVTFYDSINGSIIKRLSFFKIDDSIEVYNQQNSDKIKWINPEYGNVFDGDGNVNLFILRCKSVSQNWYEVIVDKESGDSFWISKEPNIKFQTWSEYLKKMLAVEMLDLTDSIYLEPSLYSKKLHLTGNNCFKVLELQNDWIQVIRYVDCRQFIKLDTKPLGWIRWRKNGRIVIKYDPW